MRLGLYLSSLTKPELELLKEECNLTDDESKIFSLLARGKYIREIAQKTCMSEKTVERRIKRIKRKVCRIIESKGGGFQ